MRYYIIHYTATGGRPVPAFFQGFVSIHPGTEPQGHTQAKWSQTTAILIPAEDVKKTVNDLKELGEYAFTTSAVDL